MMPSFNFTTTTATITKWCPFRFFFLLSDVKNLLVDDYHRHGLHLNDIIIVLLWVLVCPPHSGCLIQFAHCQIAHVVEYLCHCRRNARVRFVSPPSSFAATGHREGEGEGGGREEHKSKIYFIVSWQEDAGRSIKRASLCKTLMNTLMCPNG